MLPADSTIFDTTLSETSKTYLLETTRWTKFLAILGFIFIGIVILFSAMIVANGSDLFKEINPSFRSVGIAGVSLFLLLGIIIYWYPIMMLYRFSKNIKEGITRNNELMIEQGFRCQKNMYRFMGIVLIIIILLYVLLFAMGIAASLS